ncbi:hypothetical protein Tcan_06970 [Toxocara canis]|uniref:Uncharacterized protein n=1 Tax=Toxocara canis TaxID=6265 RepID=A0A0B2W5L7_TOXCA|nr:hypothetical protein Tcan_06970 [Toxocara canis]
MGGQQASTVSMYSEALRVILDTQEERQQQTLKATLEPVLMWITSTGTAYDAEFIHFHDVSVYIVYSLQPVSAASVRKCSEHCYYEGFTCIAFEYHEDGKCLMHTIIEYNGTTVPDLYIRNIKRIRTPTNCHTEEFAKKIINSLDLLTMDTLWSCLMAYRSTVACQERIKRRVPKTSWDSDCTVFDLLMPTIGNPVRPRGIKTEKQLDFHHGA